MTAIYTRQSVERADSISVEQQEETCRGALTAAELASCKTYTDRGYSGKNTDRPALQQLLQDAENGLVEKILVYRLDRISRSVHDFTGLCAQLSAWGIHFRSVTEGITLDDSPAGTVLAQIMMVFAQFERETIRRRVTDNYYARAKTGMYLGGRPPFGFDKGETCVDGKRTACYVPNGDAAQMAALFAQYLQEGETLGTLVRRLNAAGVPTARGGPWSTLPLGRLLRNPAFVRADAAVYRYLRGKGAVMNDPVTAYDRVHGCYCYAPQGGAGRKFTDLSHSFVTLAPHEGLVDAGLWLAVQHKLDRNKALKNSGAGQHSWLSGLMKCAKCGYAITVVRKADGTGHYINCGGRKRNICPGRSTVITLEQIESAVGVQLMDFLKRCRTAEIRVPQHRSEAVNRVEMKITACEEEIEGLTRNLIHIREADVVQLLSAQIHRAHETLDILGREREKLLCREAPSELEAYYEAVLREWADYTVAEKKQIARAVIGRVTVEEEEIAVFFRAAR